jgi:hypothetical protein
MLVKLGGIHGVQAVLLLQILPFLCQTFGVGIHGLCQHAGSTQQQGFQLLGIGQIAAHHGYGQDIG